MVTYEKAKSEIAREIVYYSRLSYDRYLVRAAGGNVSARLPAGLGFLITPSGVSLRAVEEKLLITMNNAGVQINGPSGLKPSKETPLHLCIYKHRPDVNAVVHVHPPFVTAFSMVPGGIPLVTAPARAKLVSVPVAKYALPGSPELVANVEQALLGSGPEVRAILLEGHGLLAFDSSLASAFDVAELAEETAQVAAVLEQIR